MNQRPRFEYDQEKVAAAMGRIGAAMGESIANMHDMFASVAKALQDAGRLPTPAPEDPRERALWAKQQRGTGPATPRDWGKR